MNVCMLIWSYWPGPEGGSERQCREIVRRLAEKGVECTVVTSMPCYIGVPQLAVEYHVRIVRLGILAPISVYLRRFIDWLFCSLRSVVCGASVERIAAFEKWQSVLTFWLMLPSVWLSRLSFLIELALFDSRTKPRWNLIHLYEPSWLCGVAVWLSRRGRACPVQRFHASNLSDGFRRRKLILLGAYTKKSYFGRITFAK